MLYDEGCSKRAGMRKTKLKLLLWSTILPSSIVAWLLTDTLPFGAGHLHTLVPCCIFLSVQQCVQCVVCSRQIRVEVHMKPWIWNLNRINAGCLRGTLHFLALPQPHRKIATASVGCCFAPKLQERCVYKSIQIELQFFEVQTNVSYLFVFIQEGFLRVRLRADLFRACALHAQHVCNQSCESQTAC